MTLIYHAGVPLLVDGDEQQHVACLAVKLQKESQEA
jgi:hypothetical protein